jgi:type IV pilus assembly protein PilY1
VAWGPVVTMLCIALMVPVLVHATGPAQIPLLNRSPNPPKPNLVFTIDDSGSMNLHYMPEGRFKIRVTDPESMKVSFPDPDVDVNFYMTDGFPGDPSKAGGWVPACSVPALVDGGETLYQRQFRSPDVNSIFYNPDVRYLPWAQTSSGRFGAAAAVAAPWEPTQPATYNLTQNPALYRSGDTTWCHDTYRASPDHGQVCTGSLWSPTCTIKFYPGLVYRLKTPSSDPTNASSYIRYNVNGGTDAHAPAEKHPHRTDCVATQCTLAEEQANFANWFTYYRSRMQLTKAALSEVLMVTRNDIRVGMASINTGVVASKPAQTVDGLLGPVLRMGVRELTAVHRDALLANLRAMTADGGTPLKGAVQEVGRYFSRADNGNPWQTMPGDGTGAGAQLACRRSYNLLTTDGYYNVEPVASPGNYDNLTAGAKELPGTDPNFRPAGAPYGYTPVKPYLDAHANTLADHASYFFVSDLRSDLPNHVEPTLNLGQPPYWQHLTQFTVGIGVSGSLDSRTSLDGDGRSFRSKTLAALTTTGPGAIEWPDPAGSAAAKIDDLWHAAVNTAGDYFSVKDASELTAALTSTLGALTTVDRRGAGVSLSGATATQGRLKFVPTYQAGSWSGDVLAYGMGTSGEFEGSPIWRAGDRLPPWASRNIVTWDGTAGVAFNTALDAATKALISVESSQQDSLIDYVRGDASHEGVGSTPLRERYGRRLPDFVNSPPILVKASLDMGYRDDFEASAYSAHLSHRQSRPEGVLFVGGNGGMLHGFAETTGAEVFAYLPRAVLGHLSRLSRPDYGADNNPHQFFVDGDLAEADAYIPTPRSPGVPGWTNLLVGSYGAGSRGIFVLDVTDLSDLGVHSVLTERSEQDNPDIGHVFSAPEVGRLGGRWFAFYGNGAYSTAGKAMLLVIDLATGAQLSFPVETRLGRNGLMGVRTLRNAATGEVEALYGGDLQGNLWRVDFARSANVADWKLGFRGAPLFTARDGTGAAQPITAKPTLATHYLGGRTVLFGTGKLMDVGDPDSRAMQTQYGVRDPTAEGDSSAAVDLTPWTSSSNHRDKLQQQVIDTSPVSGVDPATGATNTYFKTSAHAVNWDTQRGWFMDLVLPAGTPGSASAAGQRVIHPTRLIGEFAWVSTLVPGGSSKECESSNGIGYGLLLPAITGAMHDKPVFDTNADGKINDKDLQVSVLPHGADGQDGILVHGAGPFDEPPAAGSTDPSHHLVTGDGGTDIRIYCLHLGCNYQIKDRIWRQLVEPPRPD